MLCPRNGASLGDFNATNFAQVVAAVGPHLTEIWIDEGFQELVRPPFWAALRDYVVPARKLRKLRVVDIPKGVSMSDVESSAQLRGSLEELVLRGSPPQDFDPDIGLPRLPESFLTLTNLKKLELIHHFRIKAIPAGISNLKKLKELNVIGCDLRSLPKELGALTQLEHLVVTGNYNLRAVPDDVAFPLELKGMKSLRDLRLGICGLRRVPAFVREVSSLEEIWLGSNADLQFDVPLNYLVECCPRMRLVDLKKGQGGSWNPQSMAHLEAFKAKLERENPSAQVDFEEFFGGAFFLFA
jgi:Leucine-rich repeat (LRR) protein